MAVEGTTNDTEFHSEIKTQKSKSNIVFFFFVLKLFLKLHFCIVCKYTDGRGMGGFVYMGRM